MLVAWSLSSKAFLCGPRVAPSRSPWCKVGSLFRLADGHGDSVASTPMTAASLPIVADPCVLWCTVRHGRCGTPRWIVTLRRCSGHGARSLARCGLEGLSLVGDPLAHIAARTGEGRRDRRASTVSKGVSIVLPLAPKLGSEGRRKIGASPASPSRRNPGDDSNRLRPRFYAASQPASSVAPKSALALESETSLETPKPGTNRAISHRRPGPYTLLYCIISH